MTVGLHAAVAGWFTGRFGEPSEPQALGWPHIAAGHDTLIAAPTGSGKTLAAFLIAIDGLIRQAADGTLGEATEIVYVSPLKALANDVHKNLELPLAEISEQAMASGVLLPRIRVAVRTGDTLPGERNAMLRRPPHILVTTPESLYILLTSRGGRGILRTARTVIVDEIHALAANKRGAHLALSLERLDELAGAPLQRIGLSATVKPLETVAHFLVGARALPKLVQVADRRRLDLAVETPAAPLGPIATNEEWEERYERLAALAREHRSTLVFVPTRRMAERVAHRMRERLGEDHVAAHHGSLSRAIRLRAEERFKAGALQMMVATASLELGLDIGSVDLVCQLGSTRQLAAAWQRVGRAGHWKGAIPKGRFFALTRDDLIECAALVRGLRTGALDTLHVPDWPRDILAQQMVAAVAACERPEGWSEDDLFAMARQAWPYRELPREEFDALVELLSEGISSRRGRRGAFLHRDGVHHRLRPRRGARLAAITCGGAIAETASYVVQAEPENLPIGSLDEDFAVESNAGDIILLGTHSWKVRGIETGRVRVEDAHGAPPTVPFWLGEAPGRTRELSAVLAELREEIGSHEPEWLATECGLSADAARQVVTYLNESRAALGVIPSQRHLVAERFFDDGGGMQLVIHAPFGSAINKAWGMALRKRFCRGFDFELQASASENGLTLALSEQHSFPLETIFHFLRAEGVEAILEQAILQAPIFQTRWRWVVGRALALLRFSGGRKLAPQLQRMRSEDLLAAAFPMQVGCQDNHGGEDLEIPNHPYVQETMRDCLHEFVDLGGLQEVLSGLESGAIMVSAVDTPAPSGLAQEILNVGPYGFLDDAPLEERRSRAVNLRAAAAPLGPGVLDPAAVAAVCAEAWPQPQSVDELHDLLLSTVYWPSSEVLPEWRPWLEALQIDGRIVAHGAGWAAAERLPLLQGEASAGPAGVVWPGVEFSGATPTPSEAAMERIVGGWMEILGPVSEAALAQRLGLEAAAVAQALLALEGQGRVIRGEFGWCERALLARIHRRMVHRLRAEVETIAPAVFYRFLRRWQHLEAGTRLHGLRGLEAVLDQLQGFEAPAQAWEQHLLPARVADYAPELLDQLCLSGAFTWARLSASSGKRAAPTRNSPLAFFRRSEADWLLAASGWKPIDEALSAEAIAVLARLRQRGASFFADLVLPGMVKSQIEDALWELVAAGLVTADGFDNLRAFLDPKRRSGERHAAMPRHALGRWALLAAEPANLADEAVRMALAERQAQLWLRRYGVIFKALLAREASALPWYEILLACRRLEARGEIRGGRFVSGFAGEQYALPQAVEALKAQRRLTPDARTAAIAAADPLNLAGIILPGERVPSQRLELVAG
ncbi:MAG: DEAD/DEAH box helicase [Acidobacteria bacterium]|nr:MAG: DEAD/DEAH box helicase [Acidobacteriota bacterium]